MISEILRKAAVVTYKMTRDIHKVEVLRANELNWWSLEQAEMLLANVGGVVDGFASDLMNIGLGTDDPH